MKIGFLPLYIKLYDEVVPGIRPRLENFYETIAKDFESRGFEVVRAPFCRLEPEFKAAVKNFEEKGAEAIVTLHMAYSPSLESIEVLAGTKLPLVVLDTTETEEFSKTENSDEVMFCHGIHGVMDMCSMLTRYGKPYAIAAGHYPNSDVLDRVCGFVRAAIAADALRNAKVGLIGSAFEGMGDFRVSYAEMKNKLGITVSELSDDAIRAAYDGITDAEMEAEKKANAEAFDFDSSVIPEEYEMAVRSCLALRKVIAAENATAFSVNFTRMGYENCGLTSTPFLECCKAMEQGIGYAGEGDTLTAAFVGAFLKSYPESNFVEIFCPDWKNGLLFLSHMGELNYRIAAKRPLICRAGTNYTPGAFPCVGYTCMKGCKGVYLNVSRAESDYRITVSEAELVDYDHKAFGGWMQGWMKPASGNTAKFLEDLSRYGATHHSVFVTGATAEQIEYFARLIGVECKVI